MRLPYAVCSVVLRLSTELYTCKSPRTIVSILSCVHNRLFTFVFKTHICEKANKRQKDNRALVQQDNRLFSPVNKSEDLTEFDIEMKHFGASKTKSLY
jgi:hypothetical protein